MWITVMALTVGVVAWVAVYGEIAAERAPAEPLAGAGGAQGAAARPGPSRHRAPSRFSAAARHRRRTVFSRVSGAGAFERLGEPRPGDWLWSFRERGQTLQDYARIRTNRPTATRRRLHVQPYGDLSATQRAMLPPLRDYVSRFFGVAVTVLPRRPLGRAWWSAARRQHDAGRIAMHLAGKVPADSLGLIGMAGSDLFVDDLNFVFGVGLFRRRAGVYSLHRFGRDRQKLLRRSLQLATHELGHMFSLEHCVFYKCLMNGSNSLTESDRQPLHLCPVCLAKLHHNLRFNPVARYRSLARFYDDHAMPAAAAFVRARAREVTP